MRIVFYSASTSAHSNSSTKTTYQPFRADTWDEMDRLYPDCEFVVAGPLNGSYIFDVADGEICKKPEKVKYGRADCTAETGYCCSNCIGSRSL